MLNNKKNSSFSIGIKTKVLSLNFIYVIYLNF